MSAEDVETIRSGIEAYNAADLERLIAIADPDVRMVPIRSLVEGGEYRGHDGMRRFMADTDEDWSERGIEVSEIRDSEGGVLVLGDFWGIGRASGSEVRFPIAWLCRMRDGKLAGMRAYTDQDKAVAELDSV
jgi:ketosteroid isomerase-like protein